MRLHRDILTSSLLTLAAALIFSAHCLAADGGDADLLDELLANSPAAEIFPGSDEIQPIAGTPPAAPAFKHGKRIGFVFLNSTLANAVRPPQPR